MIRRILAFGVFSMMIAFMGGRLAAQEAIQLDQLKEAPGPNYFPLTEDGTIWPIPGIQVYQKFKDHHFIDSIYFMSPDSFCISLNGDSIPPVCGYIPTGGMGIDDTTYYFIITVNGSTPDTIISGENVNYVESGEIDITQGGTDITFFVPNMRDTCIHTLSKLNDTTAILHDCNGVARGTASFSFNGCEDYSMTVSNGIGSDTVFFNKCNGLRDTIIFYPPFVDDRHLDSIGSFVGDSVAFFMRDSSGGFYDTLYLHIDADLVDTDSQSLYYIQDGQFDTIGILRGNEIYLFDQDSQSLALAANILSITRGNSVDLTPYLDNDTIYQTIVKTGEAVLLSDANPNDTIADLEEEGVVYWKNGEWATDSANFHYSDVGRQLVINQDNYEANPWKLVVSGGVMVKADTFSTGETRLRLKEGFTSDYYDWIVSDDELTLETPGSLTGDDAIRIRRGAKSNTLKIDSTGVGINIGTGWVNHDFVVGGDMFLTQHYYDSFEENGDGDFSVISRVTGGTRWKTMQGSGGIAIEKNGMNDTIFFRGIDRDTLRVIILDSFPNIRERRAPYHIAFFREDSLISDYTSWDTLVLKNGAANRWIFMNDSLNSVAIGENARADNYYNSSLGAMAFQFLADTITESVNNSQIDTALNVIGGLSTFITHLTDLGYTVGQAITFDVVQTGFEMPFIDTSANTHALTGLQTFIIYSGTQLKPYPSHNYDSTGVGSFDLTASQYITFSTAIGAMSQPDKNRQIAMGDTLLQELRIGDSIRIKADTFYVHDQLMIWDSSHGQFIPGSIQGIQGYDFAHGSVIWWDTTGQVERFQEDSLNFFWSKDSARLAIGHRSPDRRLHVQENTNTRPLIAEFENTGPGHANIRLHPGSGESWDISARWEDLFYLGKAGAQPLISLSGLATDGFQIDGYNLFSFENYGNGSKSSHVQTFDSFGNGPVDYILGINANDRIKTLSFDSLGAALGIALSIPTLDSFFVDANDSLIFSFQGEDLYYSTKLPIPSGPVGDSLGTAWANNTIVRSDGTKKGVADGELLFDGSTNNLRIDAGAEGTSFLRFNDATSVGTIDKVVASGFGILDLSVTPTDGSSAAVVRFNRNAGTSGESYLDVHLGTGAFSGARVTGSAHDGWLQASGGNLGIGTQLPTEKVDINGNLRVRSLPNASFTNVLGIDATGVFRVRTLAQFLSDVGSTNIYNTDGTLTGNRKMTTADKTLTFESGTSGSFPMMKLNSTLAGGLPYFQVANATNSFEFGIKSGNNLNISNGTNNTIVMQPGAGSNRLYFATGGNIGIGTTDPDVNLHIETASGSGDAAMIKLEKAGGFGYSVIGQYYGSPHPVASERGMYIDDQVVGRWFVQEANGRGLGIYRANPTYTLDVGNESSASGSFRAVGNVLLGTNEPFQGAIGSTVIVEGEMQIKGGLKDYTGSAGATGKFLTWVDTDPGAGVDNEVVWAQTDWNTMLNIPAGFADGIDHTADADSDPNNELQSFSGATTGATNHQLILSQSGGTQTFTAGTGISFSNPGTSNVTINATGGGGSEWTDAGLYIYPSEPSDLVVVGSSSAAVATENFNIAASQATQAFWGSTTSTSSNSAGIYFNNTNMTNSLKRAGDIQAIKTTNTTGAVSIGYYDVENRRQAFYAGTAGTALRGEQNGGLFLGNHVSTNDDLRVVNTSTYAAIGHELITSASSPTLGLFFYETNGGDISMISHGTTGTSKVIGAEAWLQSGTATAKITPSAFVIDAAGSGQVSTIQDDIDIGNTGTARLRVRSSGSSVRLSHAQFTAAGNTVHGLRIDNNGSWFLGTEASGTPSGWLQTNGAMTITAGNATNTITMTGTLGINITPVAGRNIAISSNDAQKAVAGAWVGPSDERLKKEIDQIDGKDALDKILSLRGVNYEWNQKAKERGFEVREGKQWGLIAQDIISAFGEDDYFVSKDPDGYYSASYSNYDPLYIESFRYISQENETMKETISMQKTMIDTLIGEVQKLSNRITKLENE